MNSNSSRTCWVAWCWRCDEWLPILTGVKKKNSFFVCLLYVHTCCMWIWRVADCSKPIRMSIRQWTPIRWGFSPSVFLFWQTERGKGEYFWWWCVYCVEFSTCGSTGGRFPRELTFIEDNGSKLKVNLVIYDAGNDKKCVQFIGGSSKISQ